MISIDEHNYLCNIPNSCQEFGLAKVLLVRRELIHVKHIFTEIFTRKTIRIEEELEKVGMNVVDYMEFMTHRMRHITKFTRQFIVEDINKFNGMPRNHFFPFHQLVSSLNTAICLDFDGVCTAKSFKPLYDLCNRRANRLIICSANPTVEKSWFIKHDMVVPNKVYACKGKEKKLKQLIELSQKYDFLFHVDNEEEYLRIAWLFGIQTFVYKCGKIEYFSRKTK